VSSLYHNGSKIRAKLLPYIEQANKGPVDITNMDKHLRWELSQIAKSTGLFTLQFVVTEQVNVKKVFKHTAIIEEVKKTT